MPCIRDRFWIWGHEAGSHDRDWGIPASSTIEPVPAARIMGIPNVIMVRYGGEELPIDDAALAPFAQLDRLVWSVVGGGGTHRPGDVDRVLDLRRRLPNLAGVMMDDFFVEPRDGRVAVLGLDGLRNLRRAISRTGPPLDLWVVLYDHQLSYPIGDHLALCDKVTFWTSDGRNLGDLERSFAAFERVAPAGCGRILGCYMWDYGGKRPMPLSLMERQCGLGLQWLREGRIEGMIFLASCICDLGLEAVEWTRSWIAAVGDLRLDIGADAGPAAVE